MVLLEIILIINNKWQCIHTDNTITQTSINEYAIETYLQDDMHELK